MNWESRAAPEDDGQRRSCPEGRGARRRLQPAGAEPGCPSRERGAASVLVLSLVGVVLALTVGALVLASAVVASQKARVAADLGSLAGASAIQDGASAAAACATARQVVRANAAATQSCSSDGSVVDVRVSVRAGLWPEPAVARARAGPER